MAVREALGGETITSGELDEMWLQGDCGVDLKRARCHCYGPSDSLQNVKYYFSTVIDLSLMAFPPFIELFIG